MHLRPFLKCSFVLICSFACSAPTGAPLDELPESEQPLAAGRFVDIISYITDEQALDTWYAVVANLKGDFDAICGDTFCEGDFSNYQSLSFRCSVDERRGLIGQCVWVFAASQQEVSSRTGAFEITAKHWACPIHVAPRVPVRRFLSTLSQEGQSPLYARLPGSDRSIYDALTECL